MFLFSFLVGAIEKRHLQFENGQPVYAQPKSGRGLGPRQEDVGAAARQEH